MNDKNEFDARDELEKRLAALEAKLEAEMELDNDDVLIDGRIASKPIAVIKADRFQSDGGPGWKTEKYGYLAYGTSDDSSENPDIVLIWDKDDNAIELAVFPVNSHDVTIPMSKRELKTLRTNIEYLLTAMENTLL